MEKRTVYAEIPKFDETTQYVVQVPPVESDDEIFYGVEIRTLEPSNDTIHIPEPGEWVPYVPPASIPSDSERLKAVEEITKEQGETLDEVVTILEAII